MQLRRLAVLALAVAVAACSSDDGGVADPADLRLQIVSGDRQTAPVRPAGVSSTASARGAYLADLPPNLLPEPLVARIVVDGASPSASSLGPSFAALPSDLVVTFRVAQPQDQLGRDCGESFIDSAKPDADGLVTTYWERGTIAGVECRLEVRLVVNGVPRVDTAFTATFEPGPVAGISSIEPAPEVQAGDTLWIPDLVSSAHDAYFNAIDPADLSNHPAPQWAWVESGKVPAEPTDSGWVAVVPAEAAGWKRLYTHTGPNATLHTWFQGERRGGVSVFAQ